LSTKEYQKNWRKKNRLKCNEYQREWRIKNRDKCRERVKKYNLKNREYHKNYHVKNREKYILMGKKRRQKNKADAIKHLGGKCIRCGIKYNGANACIFQLHHKNPAEKKIKRDRASSVNGKLGKIEYTSWTIIKKELVLCDLLCANCHFIEHSEKY